MSRDYLKSGLTNKKGIYRISNIVSKKYYIGSSTNLSKRWWEHRKFLRLGIHSNSHLQSSWKKYGEDAFIFEVVEILGQTKTDQEILEVEQKYLDQYYGKPECYNQNKFASKPDSNKNKKPILQVSVETGDIIRRWDSAVDAGLGLDLAPGTIYSACKGKLISSGGFRWKWADDKLAAKYPVKTGHHGGHNKKRVCLVDPKTGQVLETYSSLQQAGEVFGVTYNNISTVCSGRKTAIKGKVFKYETDMTEKPTYEYFCKACGAPATSPKGLATHIQFAHKISAEQYTVKHILGENLPGCKSPGCTNRPRYVAFSFREFCKDHKRLAESEAGKRGGRPKKLALAENPGQIKISNAFSPFLYGSPKDILRTNSGFELSSKNILPLSAEERKKFVEPIFQWFRTGGFPVQKFDDQALRDSWTDLVSTATVSPPGKQIKNKKITGNVISQHFNSEEFFSVKSTSKPSMTEAFADDVMLRKVIENRLGITYKETFNIHGAMLRQGFRSTMTCAATSIFNSVVAKTVYEHCPGFSPETPRIIYDFSMGFGHRALGALASPLVEKYIACDPWTKVVENNLKMLEFLGVPKEKYDIHNVGSEQFCPVELAGKVDIAFSSPPYFDKEIYDNGNKTQAYASGDYGQFLSVWWRKTLENTGTLLKPSGVLALNMFETHKDKKILEDMLAVAKTLGFSEIDRWHLKMSESHFTKTLDKEKLEPIVFLTRVRAS